MARRPEGRRCASGPLLSATPKGGVRARPKRTIACSPMRKCGLMDEPSAFGRLQSSGAGAGVAEPDQDVSYVANALVALTTWGGAKAIVRDLPGFRALRAAPET